MAGMWTPRTAFQAEGMAVWERLTPCISLPPAWGPWVPRVCCSAPVLWSQYASCIASTSVGVQGPHSSGCTCPQTRVAGELPGSLGWPAWVCALWALPHCRYCGQGPWTVMAAGHHSTEGQGPSGPGLGGPVPRVLNVRFLTPQAFSKGKGDKTWGFPQHYQYPPPLQRGNSGSERLRVEGQG